MFTYRHRVRNHEVDAQGFVFNSRYLEIADVAFTEWVRDLGWTTPELIAAGVDPSVVQTEIAFRAPGRLDDLLDVAVQCVHVGRSSFRLVFRIVRGDEEVAEVRSAYVNVDIVSAVAVPLVGSVADAMRAVAVVESGPGASTT